MEITQKGIFALGWDFLLHFLCFFAFSMMGSGDWLIGGWGIRLKTPCDKPADAGLRILAFSSLLKIGDIN